MSTVPADTALSDASLLAELQRYRAIFEHPAELTVVLEAERAGTGDIVDWRYVDANTNALKLLGRTRENVIGRTMREVIPDREPRLGPLCARVLAERTPYRYEAIVNERVFWICIFPISANTVVSSAIDITAQRAAEHEAERASHQDRAEKEWLSAVLNSMNEEVYFTDTQQRYTYANPAAIREFEHASIAGVELRQIVQKLEVLRPDGTLRPIEEAPPLRALGGEVIRDEEQIVRIPRTGELRHRQVSSAPVRDGSGSIIGAVSVVRDVTDQKRIHAELQTRDLRSSALVRLGDEFRTLMSPTDLAFAAARVLGETLNASRCGYGTIDVVGETVTIERDWSAPGIASLTGVLRFGDYGSYFADLRRGDTVVCEDAVTDPRTSATAAALTAISARSFVNMPIIEQGQLVAHLYISQGAVRRWTPDELAFIREVAERTRIAVERRRNEQAVANDLKDTRLLRDLAARLVGEGDATTLFEEILDAAMVITEAEGGTIQLLDPETRVPTFVARRAIDQELWACTQSTPLVSRSGEPLGMFSTHWRSPHEMSERELRFLDLLARQAADLVERVRAQEKLRASEAQLREADRRKDEFIAVLAHELRNPLVPIRTGTELLKSAREKPALIDAVRPMMERQLRHMVRLIDDLLDVSRITSGKMELQKQRVTLSSVITSAVEANRAALSGGNLDLSVTLADPSRILHVDATRFSQVISNLLQNATKFTPDGGRIAINATIASTAAATGTTNGDELVVTVSDTGIGISPELLPGVFDLFAQAHPDSVGRHAGLGIGLALARRLVELHGGTLTARSEGIGKGSEFVVRIPAPAHIQPASPIREISREELEGVRVAVVDDNRDGADAMGLLIANMGCEVRVFYDGPGALAMLEEFAPQIVLLDIGMPGLDGYDTCRQMRAMKGGSISIVAVTGWGQEHDRRLAAEAGFDNHLTKPADPATLAELIAGLRRRR